MLQHYSKVPLEYETFTAALIRIAVAQVVLDYRHNPDAYATFPPARILALAEEQRRTMPSLTTFGHLVYISKALVAGFKLAEICQHNPKAVWRTIAKRAVGDRRKQLPPY